MLMLHLVSLLRLYVQPARAMSDILDRGSWLVSAGVALVTGLLLVRRSPLSFYEPLLLLALCFVPAALAAASALAPAGSFRGVFERDYTGLLSCAAMGWSAAHLPLVLLVGAPGMTPYWLIPFELFFTVLAVVAMRTVSGLGVGQGIVAAAIAWIGLAGGLWLTFSFGFLFRFLASPFALYYGYLLLGEDVQGLGTGLRARQQYRRHLEAAAINEHDGDAQYQLGLIHLERRQFGEAIARFEKAVAIDPSEAGPHFQLGRIAREQGRIEDALRHFGTTVRLDPKHSQNEVWREFGAAYLAAGRAPEAREALERYVERRPYDAEGLFYYGQALERAGDAAGARDAWQRALDACDSAPSYRRRQLRRWSRASQKEMKRLTR